MGRGRGIRRSRAKPEPPAPEPALTSEQYLSSPHPVCQYCKIPDKSVHLRLDPYAYELYQGGDVRVEICDSCVAERAAEI